MTAQVNGVDVIRCHGQVHDKIIGEADACRTGDPCPARVVHHIDPFGEIVIIPWHQAVVNITGIGRDAGKSLRCSALRAGELPDQLAGSDAGGGPHRKRLSPVGGMKQSLVGPDVYVLAIPENTAQDEPGTHG